MTTVPPSGRFPKGANGRQGRSVLLLAVSRRANAAGLMLICSRLGRRPSLTLAFGSARNRLSVTMSFRVVRGYPAAWRGLVTLLTAAAFLFALAASDAPSLHEQIHKTQGAGHECVVTMLSAGGLALGGAAMTITAPAPAPEACPFLPPPSVHGNAPLDFLLLEHAPPARA